MPPEWTSAARGPADGDAVGCCTTGSRRRGTSGQPVGTDQRTSVPRGSAESTVAVPPRASARCRRLTVPPPATASVGDADTVVGDGQRQLVANVDPHLDLGGPGVAGDVGQRLAEHGEEVFGPVRRPPSRWAPLNRTSGAKPRTASSFSTTSMIWRRRLACSRVWAVKRKMVWRMSRMVWSSSSITPPTRASISDPAWAAAACRRHAGGEQPLDDGVVEIPGDAFPVLEHRQLLFGCPAGPARSPTGR